MNITQAKRINLQSYLATLGYEPECQKKDQLWYLSPFRHETVPSFKVNPQLNAWYDFAEGKGGDIIDFMKAYQRVSSVSDALTCIERIVGNEPLRKKEPLPLAKRKQEPAITLDSIGPVRSKALLAYLNKRGISHSLAASRVQEAHYRCDGKRFFALAFENDAGGCELRNPMWKGTLGTKDITTIDGSSRDKVAVFEGFFDYLSAITMNGGSLDASAIILNSVAFRERAVKKIKEWGCNEIDLYRDNDKAGLALLNYMTGELPACEVVDRAELYNDHSDLNAWHAERICAPAIG